MFVIAHKKIFLLISVLTILLAIFSTFFFGLKFGIDFQGGTLMEIGFPADQPSFEELEGSLKNADIGTFVLQSSGEDGYIIRAGFLSDEDRQVVTEAASVGGTFEVVEERFNSIGPVVGEELKKKAWIAIFVTISAIILFIAFAFRKVSQTSSPREKQRISSWTYSISAVIALAHDIIIPVGLFAFLGYWVGAEIDILFIMALLAILGYSVNDTIVVFDRVRENLLLDQENRKNEDFETIVGKSLNQTLFRSLNTSLTTLFGLAALFVLGGEVVRNFSLALLVGIIAGTYSSIFLATPLLVQIQEWRAKKN